VIRIATGTAANPPRIEVSLDTIPGPVSSPADDAHHQRTAKEIVGQIKTRLGVSCEVVIKASGEVPRSQGKAVRVKDLRKKM